MRNKILVLVCSLILLTVFLVTAVAAHEDEKDDGHDLADVRRATARFQRIQAAQTAGYDLRPGLDYCFDKPGVGGMGYHYINTGILDLKLDPLKPEAMVYAPGQNGKLKLGAVEYIVPAADWKAAGHSKSPSVLGHHLHLNSNLGVYVLHAWIWQHNPKGVFEDWNPTVSCP